MINKDKASEILELVGGKSNVLNLTHCATRLRFQLKNITIPNRVALENMKEVLKVLESGGQFQIVIGPEVPDYFNEIMRELGGDNVVNSTEKEKKNYNLKVIVNSIFDIISASFTPLLPVIAGAGVLRALMMLMSAIGLVQNESSTMLILTGIQNSFFYFLPIILSVSMAKKLNVNPYIAAAIGASLLEPNITGLIGERNVTFFGLPMTIQNYSNTVFPVLIAIPLYAFIYNKLNTYVPKLINVLIVPVLSITIVVPAVLFVLGPFGIYFGQLIANFINFLFANIPLLAGAFLGGTWTLLVLLGLHWSIIPISIASLASTGSDAMIACAGAATYAAIGVAIGVLIKSKDKDLRALMVSGIIPLLFAGISEPILYGATLRYKKLLYISMLTGAIGGAISALVETKITILFFSILTLQTNVNWFGGVIAGFSTVILTIVLIYILGYDTEKG